MVRSIQSKKEKRKEENVFSIIYREGRDRRAMQKHVD